MELDIKFLHQPTIEFCLDEDRIWIVPQTPRRPRLLRARFKPGNKFPHTQINENLKMVLFGVESHPNSLAYGAESMNYFELDTRFLAKST